MIEVKDKYTLSIVATLIANTIKNIIDYSLYVLDITEHSIYQIAASAYFSVADTRTLPALIVGIFTDYAVAMILGLLIVYVLYYTSSDYFLVKGISVGLLSWLLVFGIILRMKVGRIDPVDPATNLVNLIEHLLLGALIAFFIVKYGKNFAPRKQK
mgnify:CR=1 FL=1